MMHKKAWITKIYDKTCYLGSFQKAALLRVTDAKLTIRAKRAAQVWNAGRRHAPVQEIAHPQGANAERSSRWIFGFSDLGIFSVFWFRFRVVHIRVLHVFYRYLQSPAPRRIANPRTWRTPYPTDKNHRYARPHCLPPFWE